MSCDTTKHEVIYQKLYNLYIQRNAIIVEICQSINQKTIRFCRVIVIKRMIIKLQEFTRVNNVNCYFLFWTFGRFNRAKIQTIDLDMIVHYLWSALYIKSMYNCTYNVSLVVVSSLVLFYHRTLIVLVLRDAHI